MIRCWHGKFGDVAVLAVVDDAIVVSCHDVFIDELVKFGFFNKIKSISVCKIPRLDELSVLG